MEYACIVNNHPSVHMSLWDDLAYSYEPSVLLPGVLGVICRPEDFTMPCFLESTCEIGTIHKMSI